MNLYKIFDKDNLPMTIFTGVFIPIISIYIGSFLSKRAIISKEKNDEKNQRIKLLSMLHEELEVTIKHFENTRKYYSRESFTCNLIINSSAFNMSEHSNLLSKIWGLVREYQSLNTAIESIPAMFSPLHQKIVEANTNILGQFNEKKWIKDSDNINQKVQDTLYISVKSLIEAARLLKTEVESLLAKYKLDSP